MKIPKANLVEWAISILFYISELYYKYGGMMFGASYFTFTYR
jgi:hypothetical protein